MNDVDSRPVKQGWSAAWLAAKFILAVPTLGVVCVAFWLAIVIAVEMMDACPSGFLVGHFPCGVALVFLLIVLLIVGVGIWLLLWIGRLEVIWNRLQSWFARNARVAGDNQRQPMPAVACRCAFGGGVAGACQ